jgi:hypothetical protein
MFQVFSKALQMHEARVFFCRGVYQFVVSSSALPTFGSLETKSSDFNASAWEGHYACVSHLQVQRAAHDCCSRSRDLMALSSGVCPCGVRHQSEQHQVIETVKAQLIDFSLHILKLCDDHCSLVRESGVLRVDVGIEIIRCRNGETEQSLKDHQKHPKLWHRASKTGDQFIVRFYCNEVRCELRVAGR